MRINFTKYQGTGNDFIMLDNLTEEYTAISIQQIQFLCNRKLGIGADGLIKISPSDEFDFEVEYFNADGSQSFCGNGARCSVVFAQSLGVIENKTRFSAIDGAHTASILDGIVRLEMLPTSKAEIIDGNYVLDTGSPHYVRFIDENEQIDIVEYGKEIRYSKRFSKEGINVNLLTVLNENSIEVQTYERGVENETLSCGTGVTACALVYMKELSKLGKKINVSTKGGVLIVEATVIDDVNGFDGIWLSGPAQKIFDGSIIV